MITTDPASDFPALLEVAVKEALAVFDQFVTDTRPTLNAIERIAFNSACTKIRLRLPDLVKGVFVRKATEFEAMKTSDLMKIIDTMLRGPNGVKAFLASGGVDVSRGDRYDWELKH